MAWTQPTSGTGFCPARRTDYLNKVKDALVEREMVLADLCVDQAHIWEDDPNVREQHYQNALAHLKAAAMLGARFVRIDAGQPRVRPGRMSSSTLS